MNYALALILFATLAVYAADDTASPITEPLQQESSQPTKDEDVPPTEDLMREHGVLRRILLIYEEVIHRIKHHKDIPVSALTRAVDIIRSFIEEYHERSEENYIFPLFEKKGIELKLVKTLRIQHERGRNLTNQLKEMLTAGHCYKPRHKRTIQKLLRGFIAMYRPHAAREDTVLFPLVRTLMSEEEFKKLGDMFEESEHKLFGKEGFEGIVKEVSAIEEELGIASLEQFTP